MMFFSPCDMPVAEFFAHTRTMGATYFFINLSELAGPLSTAGVSLVIALALYLRKRFAAIAGLAVAVGGANAAWVLLKQVIERPRPPHALAAYVEVGSSFPSGHATNAFALASFLSLVALHSLPRSWARTALVGTLIALAALIACGRVYLGVQYVSDVVAGAVLGSIFGFAGYYLEAKLTATKQTR